METKDVFLSALAAVLAGLFILFIASFFQGWGFLLFLADVMLGIIVMMELRSKT